MCVCVLITSCPFECNSESIAILSSIVGNKNTRNRKEKDVEWTFSLFQFDQNVATNWTKEKSYRTRNVESHIHLLPVSGKILR